MPTRKQRRRRQKEKRHEYEIVYLDGEGREVEPEDAKPRDDRRNGKRSDKRPAQKGRGGRPVKEVQPPSWNRVVKRALIFGPLIFIAFSLINSGQPICRGSRWLSSTPRSSSRSCTSWIARCTAPT